jgi:hypothetical protein
MFALLFMALAFAASCRALCPLTQIGAGGVRLLSGGFSRLITAQNARTARRYREKSAITVIERVISETRKWLKKSGAYGEELVVVTLRVTTSSRGA